MIELILNPSASHGRSKLALAQVVPELTARGIPYHVSETTSPGHATQLAADAIARGVSGIAVLGGDGMLSEVCQAMRGTDVTLYFVPCGTGNDFIRVLNLPKDPLAALKLQLDSPKRRIDCGTMNEYTFLNVGGSGFDIEVLEQTERFKHKMRGLIPYLLGLLVGLKNFRPFDAEITLDGVKQHRSFTIVSIANGQYIGGGMRVAPKAICDDGMFDVMLVDALRKWQFYLYVPLFIPGLHTRLSIVRRVRAKEVTIKSTDAFTVQLDGELRPVTKACFKCHPGSIQIACPK